MYYAVLVSLIVTSYMNNRKLLIVEFTLEQWLNYEKFLSDIHHVLTAASSIFESSFQFTYFCTFSPCNT